VDLVTEGAKPRLVAELGAQYHSTPVAELTLEPDIVIECTGVGEVVIDATHLAAPGAAHSPESPTANGSERLSWTR
jgi:hypothetical protein